IAASGANYHGLDIAHGPVEMGNYRLSLLDHNRQCVVGSILTAPYDDHTFDYVVSIGCLHHTGNLDRSLNEVFRVLRPGGKAIIMLYYAFSFRRWRHWPAETARQVVSDWLSLGAARIVSEDQRHQYDYDSEGRTAPETAFTS